MCDFFKMKRDPNKTWSSSFILPEHRERLMAYYDSQKDIIRPVLDHDQLEELHYTALQYIEDASKVYIEYWDKKRIYNVTGYMIRFNRSTKQFIVQKEPGDVLHIGSGQILAISKMELSDR